MLKAMGFLCPWFSKLSSLPHTCFILIQLTTFPCLSMIPLTFVNRWNLSDTHTYTRTHTHTYFSQAFLLSLFPSWDSCWKKSWTNLYNIIALFPFAYNKKCFHKVENIYALHYSLWHDNIKLLIYFLNGSYKSQIMWNRIVNTLNQQSSAHQLEEI